MKSAIVKAVCILMLCLGFPAYPQEYPIDTSANDEFITIILHGYFAFGEKGDKYGNVHLDPFSILGAPGHGHSAEYTKKMLLEKGCRRHINQ